MGCLPGGCCLLPLMCDLTGTENMRDLGSSGRLSAVNAFWGHPQFS